ncbi:MAG: dTDP-4-dehydrorhamnose 3,5-epimerase [Chitinivibrionales bacterium]|nr:dTDP-4-dehydrorhamnose 3,5-epimerase [Chitinivibrionales bacterium]MBD3358858.1 dTDP-4-dehydrorhamnose 3,5-epimerase [Chitinivibrionales bacterium]
MKFIKASIPDVVVIEPRVFEDERGFFLESYSRKVFADNGVDAEFVQDNHSLSVQKGVVRGLHFQTPPATQAKLLRVTAGAVWDVVVDLRSGSPTYGQWEGFELTATDKRMIFVPRGFAHGFCTLAPNTEVIYKVDNLYSKEHDGGVRWDDPDLGISWPIDEPILSAKDRALPLLADFSSPFQLHPTA